MIPIKVCIRLIITETKMNSRLLNDSDKNDNRLHKIKKRKT